MGNDYGYDHGYEKQKPGSSRFAVVPVGPARRWEKKRNTACKAGQLHGMGWDGMAGRETGRPPHATWPGSGSG